MKKHELKSRGAASYSSAMKHRRLLSVAAVLLVCCLVFVGAAGAENVAKVGNTEYATINEAITAWTTGTTLTLLSDVMLSDVIKLSSTEYHILDLGTYTMTAANGKNAIEIINNGRLSAGYALDIKADKENPGGITAAGKACVKTTGKSGVKDRPIIRIYGGVFTALNCLSHSGSNGTNCPQFWIYGGTFNGAISANRALIQISGGTFNGALICSVDSSAYMLINGGRFTKLSNLYGSSLNSNKFTIGSAKGTFDRDVYVDDDGYYVVCKSENKPTCEASVSVSYTLNEYLYYSSAATNGLYYKDISAALKFAKYKGTITLFDEYGDNFNVADEGSLTLDITDDNAGLTSTVTLGSGASKFIIKYKVDEPISWTVIGKDGRKVTNSTTEEDGVVTNTYEHLFAITFNTAGGSEIPQIEQTSGTIVTAPEDSPAKDGYTFAGWGEDFPLTMPAEDLTITAQWTPNSYSVTFNANGGEGSMEDQPFTYDVEQALTALNFTKVGHTFNGWNTVADGSGTEYTDEQLVKNLTTEKNGVVTLYANWTVNQYTITFNTDGGSEVGPITQDYGTDVTAPADPTKDGYIFAGWDTQIPATMPAEDITINALWDMIPVSSSSGGSNEGNYLSYPRTTTNGGVTDFGSSKVVKALLLPEGSSGSVVLNIDSIDHFPEELETEYTFDISVEKLGEGKLGEGTAYIHFEISEDKLTALELTAADICAYHEVDGVWVKLPTAYEVKDGVVCYTAETDSFSPFKLVIEKGAAVPKAEETVPTIPPTEEPEDKPVDEPEEILPPIDPVEPTEPASPAPLAAVLVGLGAAVLLRRK